MVKRDRGGGDDADDAPAENGEALIAPTDGATSDIKCAPSLFAWFVDADSFFCLVLTRWARCSKWSAITLLLMPMSPLCPARAST